MLLYKDIISGDEMFSGKFIIYDDKDVNIPPLFTDAFKITEIDGIAYEETSFDKKSFMTYIKGYMKEISKRLMDSNPDRVGEFQKGASTFVKKILENFKDYEFYVGESMNPEGMVALLNYREDGVTPFLTYFKDGLSEEKL